MRYSVTIRPNDDTFIVHLHGRDAYLPLKLQRHSVIASIQRGLNTLLQIEEFPVGTTFECPAFRYRAEDYPARVWSAKPTIHITPDYD